MDLQSEGGFKEEREASGFLNELWILFGSFSAIQEYAYACYDAIYGKPACYSREKYNMPEGWFNSFWIESPDNKRYENDREYFLLIENVFYGLIYNIDFLKEEDMDEIYKSLSKFEFYKKASSISDVKKSFSAFIGSKHPGLGYLNVDSSSLGNGYVRAMFYGALASLLWRCINHEVTRVRGHNSDPAIRYIDDLIRDARALLGRLGKETVYSGVNAINKDGSDPIKRYIDSLLVERRKKEIFSEDLKNRGLKKSSESKMARLLIIDTLFCLREPIEAGYSLERPPISESDRQSAIFSVSRDAYDKFLSNGLKVAHHWSALFEPHKRHVENIKKYVLKNVVDDIYSESFHDYVSDCSHELKNISMSHRGTFWIIWSHGLNLRYDIDISFFINEFFDKN